MIVEVCVNSLQSAINAEKAGADRLELCSELGVGGITPSFGLLKSIKQEIKIPVHVLIRPRSGDFTYAKHDFDIMKTDIQQCVEMGFEGVVSGILMKDYTLDQRRTEELIEISQELTFTFHRAFDWVRDPGLTFKQLQSIGVNYVLSSGQQNAAIKGLPLLEAMRKLEKSCRIMPGGGINATNAQTFLNAGFQAIHLSGTKFHKTLEVAPKVSMNSDAFLKEDQLAITSIAAVEKVIEIVK